MKIMITFLSIITIVLGLIPFATEKFPIPNKGTTYAIIVCIWGILMIVMGFANNLLLGYEKFALFILGGLVIFVAIHAFFPIIPLIVIDTLFFNGPIILIGLLGFFFGAFGMG